MPTKANFERRQWVPRADITPLYGVAFAPDPRVFDPYDENDVAQCLKESSQELAVYDHMPGVDIEALALDSAREIIGRRQALLEERQSEAAHSDNVVTTITKHVVEAHDPHPVQVVKKSRRLG